jgi:L-ascorbate metabolism protein UlaG (beta-lactamase superfamily)
MLAKAAPIPGGLGRRWRGYSLYLSSLLILTAVCLASFAMAAETLCEPGFVQEPSPSRRVIPVAAINPEATTRLVTIQWLGHSSFLLITPGGTTALTDPHSWHVSPVAPDVVTISNEHSTHNQAHSVPGSARLLRGRTTDGKAVEINIAIGDLSIKGLPSSGGNAIAVPVQNTIFVFRTEGLCIVHLGNLRGPLNDEQRQRLGRPDVLMVPIDGQWTLPYDQVASTIALLRPAIVLPMHYDVPEHARLFMQFIKDTISVRTLGDTTLKLTRATLPSASEVIVLGYREGER